MNIKKIKPDIMKEIIIKIFDPFNLRYSGLTIKNMTVKIPWITEEETVNGNIFLRKGTVLGESILPDDMIVQ